MKEPKREGLIPSYSMCDNMATNEQLKDDLEYWYGELLLDYYEIVPDPDRMKKSLEGFVHTAEQLIEQI